MRAGRRAGDELTPGRPPCYTPHITGPATDKGEV